MRELLLILSHHCKVFWLPQGTMQTGLYMPENNPRIGPQKIPGPEMFTSLVIKGAIN